MVGVVLSRSETTNNSIGVGRFDLDDDAVGCTNKEKYTEKNHPDMKEELDLLRKRSLQVVAMVV
jgi:hypothetical protein